MNPIYRTAAASHELGFLGASMTALFFLTFVWWTWWAFRPANKAHLENCGRMPLDDGGEA
jgi:cbb3-type cytochrome oxidase subunit 3